MQLMRVQFNILASMTDPAEKRTSNVGVSFNCLKSLSCPSPAAIVTFRDQKEQKDTWDFCCQDGLYLSVAGLTTPRDARSKSCLYRDGHCCGENGWQ